MSTAPFIILDLDGTLLNTSFRHYAVYRLVACNAGIEPLQFSDYWRLRRAGLSNMVVLLQGGLPNSKRDIAKSMWLKHIESMTMLKLDKMFPGVLEWLQKRVKNVKFILSTLRSNPQALEIQIKLLGLTDYFEQIKVIPHQANPSSAKASSILDDAPDKILGWVGDTEVDMDAARKIGVLAIGVTSGMRTSQALRAAGAAKIYNCVTEIETWK